MSLECELKPLASYAVIGVEHGFMNMTKELCFFARQFTALVEAKLERICGMVPNEVLELSTPGIERFGMGGHCRFAFDACASMIPPSRPGGNKGLSAW
jgi:hypothetical protein